MMREVVSQGPSRRYYPGIYLMWLRKTWENFSEDGGLLGLNPRPSECYANTLSLTQDCSVWKSPALLHMTIVLPKKKRIIPSTLLKIFW